MPLELPSFAGIDRVLGLASLKRCLASQPETLWRLSRHNRR